MADKVIHEVRFVETDDGFRIEVKGDKDILRCMADACMGSPRMGFGHGTWGRGPRFGRRFRRFAHHWGGPGPCWWDDEEIDESEPGGEPDM